MADRDIQKEFYDILTPKDCSRFSKTAKSNLEDAVSKMSHTYKDIENKLKGGEYTSHQPDVNQDVMDYYDEVINSFKKSLEGYVKTGNWNNSIPSVSGKTKELFDGFMVYVGRHGDYFNGRPDLVSKAFEKMVKNLSKNGFSASSLNQKKDEEAEAKKPKLPEQVSYSEFDSYDSKRMAEYKTNSRGEQMAHSSYLQKRQRQFYFSKQYTSKYPIISDYLKDIFNALDNAWFSYISGNTSMLDLSKADEMFKKYTEENPVIKQFDNKVCSARMIGGSFTYWDCKDSLWKMEAARNKVIKTVTMEKENTYSLWEKSVDSILNDEGKPSLNAYLDKWVKNITDYYTNPDRVDRWKSEDARLKKEIKEIETQIKQMADDWFESHKNDKSQSWRYIRDGYQDTEEYRPLNSSLKSKKAIKADNDRELSIANMGEVKIREMFKQQAADAKKAFVTAVCEKAGILKSGAFYWSEQNTGHLNGTVIGQDDKKWKITSFFAGGYNIQKLHTRTKITQLKSN